MASHHRGLFITVVVAVIVGVVFIGAMALAGRTAHGSVHDALIRDQYAFTAVETCYEVRSVGDGGRGCVLPGSQEFSIGDPGNMDPDS